MNESLNPEQLEAALHIEGPMLVLAGAGSGKTRIITHRIAHLLTLGVPASEILALTFTNKAAEEMRHRIQKIAQQTVLACTFHSLCARILRESIGALGYANNFVIYDEDDTEKLLKECLVAFGLKEDKSKVKALRSQISQLKNDLISPEEIGKADDELVAKSYRLYQEKLKSYGALDFDDLLFLTVRLLGKHADILKRYQETWTYLLIDEYQDTNAAQYEIVRLLGTPRNHIFAVGDPDQSIYSWRGARVQNILNFQRDFPGAKVVTLEQNYRSRDTILQAANALIRHNLSRVEKNLWSARGEGEKIGLYICDSENAEADFVVTRIKHHHLNEQVPLRECAIFYRTNSQSRTFEDALLRHRLSYVIIGGLSFYHRREIKDVLSLLRMVEGGSDFLSFARSINLPKRGLGEVALAKLKACSEEHHLPIFATCQGILAGYIESPLPRKQIDGLQEYIGAIEQLREMQRAKVPLHELISALLEKTRYLEYLREDKESYQERRQNVEELVAKAVEWEGDGGLVHFLEELSLKSSLDQKDLQQDAVRLMTLHNSKGLEFQVVALVGMEEDLFPHLNSRETPEQLEEERRLCYVGMTRAKEHLYLTAARFRFLWGTSRLMRPSRFLGEIPEQYIQPMSVSRPVFTGHMEKQEDMEKDEGALSIGTTVHHRDFGQGTIQKSYHTSLGLTYDVLFPKAGITRSLVAKYAKLTTS